MCSCQAVLKREQAQKELEFMRCDRPKVILGNGERNVFDVVFVAEDRDGREVTLHCNACGTRWLISSKNGYSCKVI